MKTYSSLTGENLFFSIKHWIELIECTIKEDGGDTPNLVADCITAVRECVMAKPPYRHRFFREVIPSFFARFEPTLKLYPKVNFGWNFKDDVMGLWYIGEDPQSYFMLIIDLEYNPDSPMRMRGELLAGNAYTNL